MATCTNVFEELKQLRSERDMYKRLYERAQQELRDLYQVM